MKFRLWTWIISISILSACYFFYWAVIYETTTWGKPIDVAVASNPFNIAMFFVSVILILFSYLLKKSRFATINFGKSLQRSTEIPEAWQKEQPKEKSKGKKFDFQPDKSRSKFRLPGLRKIKRKIAWLVFLIDVLIILFTLSTAATLVVASIFIINGFYVLDYIWKTRTLTLFEERQIVEETVKNESEQKNK